MAKIKDVALPDIADETASNGKVKVAPEVLKQARLLADIAGLYRHAATALKTGDDLDYNRTVELIGKYQSLFEALARVDAEKVTAEGLAAISEM